MITTLDSYIYENKEVKDEKITYGFMEIPEVLTLEEISRLVPTLNIEAQKFFYNSVIATNYNDLDTDELNLSNHELKQYIKEKVTPQRLKLAQDTTSDGLLWINAEYIVAVEDFTELIEVTNDYDGTVFGTINKAGEVLSTSTTAQDGFNLNKLIIEEKNNDKRYNIGINELKRLKAGESISKGVMYCANDGGTTLRFLKFTHLL